MYGSRANGSSYEASDVDLVFFPEISSSTGNTQEIRYKEMDMQLRLKSAFQESCIPFFVDILSRMTIPGNFQKEILHQKYVVIQEGKEHPVLKSSS